MKILLTGATGYIAQRLLPVLLENGHEVVCCVRDKNRYNTEKYTAHNLGIIEVNFLEKETLKNIPSDIDAAYYLISAYNNNLFSFLSASNTRQKSSESPPEISVMLFLPLLSPTPPTILSKKPLTDHIQLP